MKKNNPGNEEWTSKDSITRAYHIGTANKVSGKILGIEYHAFWDENEYSGCITNSKNDTLVKDKSLNSNPEFTDFDQDDLTDIVFRSNIKNEYDLIKFDTLTKRFRKVENFNKFPDPKRIANSKYWFSYHSAGCADECWESDLFYVENYKAVKIGNISKYYIDENGNIDFTINKVIKGKLISLQHIDKKLAVDWEKDKFESIENYWKANYVKFISADR